MLRVYHQPTALSDKLLVLNNEFYGTSHHDDLQSYFVIVGGIREVITKQLFRSAVLRRWCEQIHFTGQSQGGSLRGRFGKRPGCESAGGRQGGVRWRHRRGNASSCWRRSISGLRRSERRSLRRGD